MTLPVVLALVCGSASDLILDQIGTVHFGALVQLSDVLVECERPFAVLRTVGAGKSRLSIAIVLNVLNDATPGGEPFWTPWALEATARRRRRDRIRRYLNYFSVNIAVGVRRRCP